jgi:alcohol dehydrogenase class IV
VDRLATVFAWQSLPVRFGVDATAEVGPELATRAAARALIVTDGNLVAAGVVARVEESLRAAGIAVRTWAGAEPEPRDTSIAAALRDLGGERFDGYVGVGGGSVMDTAKLFNLLQTHGGELTDYLAPPFGAGRPVPGPLRPMIGVPTTAGTGSECTAVAVVEIAGSHVKAAVSNEWLRPALAVVDPRNTLSLPPAVTASSGYDALVQALESYTTLPYDRRPAPATPADRPVYGGTNPIADVWCERALQLAGRSLRRAVRAGDDLRARTDMCLAALFSRLGNAGVHLPHAAAYAIAASARDYRPPGFRADRDFVPHGVSVVVTAPAAFELTYPGAPDRHLRAAELLGVPESDRRGRPETCLSDWLRGLIAETGGPPGLAALGLSEADIPGLVASTRAQTRLLAGLPEPVGDDDIAGVLRASL